MIPSDPFEEELRGLRPAPPPPHLANAIARALEHPAATATPAALALERRRRRARQASLWLAWGIAAGMTVAFLHSRAQAPRLPHDAGANPAATAPAAPPVTGRSGDFMAVSTTNTLVGALDEGVVFLEDGRPARKVRYEFVDTVNLRATGGSSATIDVSYPREEIRLVPVDAL